MTRTGTPRTTTATPFSPIMGHDARDGFCPVCGTVAPCYRARRLAAAGGAPA
ncbi:MAG: hypothetical protein ACXV3A_06685 [Kineosporiaceae bacterium]